MKRIRNTGIIAALVSTNESSPRYSVTLRTTSAALRLSRLTRVVEFTRLIRHKSTGSVSIPVSKIGTFASRLKSLNSGLSKTLSDIVGISSTAWMRYFPRPLRGFPNLQLELLSTRHGLPSTKASQNCKYCCRCTTPLLGNFLRIGESLYCLECSLSLESQYLTTIH